MTDHERWFCPHCGRTLLSGNESCGGSFLERDHPSAVEAVHARPISEIKLIDVQVGRE